MKKKVTVILSAVVLCLFLVSCEREPIIEPTVDQVGKGSLKSPKAVAGFKVSGTKLKDAFGNTFIMRGINYPHAWYTKEYPTAIPAIAEAGANTIRIVLSKLTKVDVVKKLIAECEKNSLVVILENHDFTSSTKKEDLLSAANYFVGLKDALIGKEDRVIINIANEWYGNTVRSNTWKNAYVEAIKIIREDGGLKHTIMIDGGLSGQDANSISSYGTDLLNADPDENIIFSLHIYISAGKTATMIKDNIDKILDKNLALCIGEFGWIDVDEETVMSYCKEKKVGWLAWSWKGNSGNVKDLDMSKEWDGSSLTDWGETVINGDNGLQETSKMCLVYRTINAKDQDWITIGPLEIGLAYAKSYVIYGKWHVNVEDGVKFYNKDGTNYSSICGGSWQYPDPADYGPWYDGDQIMTLGNNVKVKHIIWSQKSDVCLGEDPNTYVAGNINAMGNIKGKTQSGYKGIKMKNLSVKYNQIGALGMFETSNVEFKYNEDKEIDLSHETRSKYGLDNPLKPGTYGRLFLEGNQTFAFKEGTYYFQNFVIDPYVELYFPPNKKVIIFVAEDFILGNRSKMLSMIDGEKKGANPANILVVCGAKYGEAVAKVSYQASWRGTLIVLNGYMVILDNGLEDDGAGTTTKANSLLYQTLKSEGDLYGAFFARFIKVEKNLKIYHVPFDWDGI